MTLLANWSAILLHAWSVRWIIAAALLSGAEVALPLIATQLEAAEVIPRGALALLAALTSAGALIARILAQPDAAK